MNAPSSFGCYHLLLAAQQDVSETGERLLAATVDGVLTGLRPHTVYVRAAAAASAREPQARTLARLVSRLMLDANPVAALFGSARSSAHFIQRWNGWHAAAVVGVRTALRTTDAGLQMVRTPCAPGPAADWRSAMVAECTARLNGRSIDARPPTTDALASVVRRLGVERGAAAELLLLLRAQPELGLAQAASAIAVSDRTLQRALGREHLSFSRLRQAARIVLSADMIRAQPGLTLTDVAHAAGFFDSAHFTHAWRASCGVSPTRYRALARDA